MKVVHPVRSIKCENIQRSTADPVNALIFRDHTLTPVINDSFKLSIGNGCVFSSTFCKVFVNANFVKGNRFLHLGVIRTPSTHGITTIGHHPRFTLRRYQFTDTVPRQRLLDRIGELNKRDIWLIVTTQEVADETEKDFRESRQRYPSSD
ncbi:MAG: hypothetical protein GY789_23085, partial [Hyphomicrobiales bacterium]|nr:hypothetical protein [Hyphomicrobiales bacterium]